MRKLLFFSTLIISLVFTACIENVIDDNSEDDLSNNQIMNRLNITDPGIWNSLCTQCLTDTTVEANSSFNLKVATRINEYPYGDDYYFALFEDLYPSEGDYDFNDVMLRSKLGWGRWGNTHTGYVNSTLINRGGVLETKVGLMFYAVSGNTFTRIPYENIIVNGERLSDEPWSEDLSELGDEWSISYEFESPTRSIWINYFIEVRGRKILTSGFAPVEVESFQLPRPEYLSDDLLPWGLEIETDEFAIPIEKELFLNAYPEFQDWAESSGAVNTRWYESPDLTYSYFND